MMSTKSIYGNNSYYATIVSDIYGEVPIIQALAPLQLPFTGDGIFFQLSVMK